VCVYVRACKENLSISVLKRIYSGGCVGGEEDLAKWFFGCVTCERDRTGQAGDGRAKASAMSKYKILIESASSVG
jgi:hypothetical protein